MISVLLADDHIIVRSGIKYLINRQSDMKVLYEAENGDEAVQIALEKQPDVVIMDLNMPKKNGLLAIQLIHQKNRDIRIIVLTMQESRECFFRALKAGASSYLLKSYHEDHLIEAIRSVNRGDVYLYPYADSTPLLEDNRKGRDFLEDEFQAILTEREQDILSFLAKGYTNREIAEKLYLSVKTIEFHKSKIMGKLSLKTRADIVEYAFKNGYLEYE